MRPQLAADYTASGQSNNHAWLHVARSVLASLELACGIHKNVSISFPMHGEI